MSSQRDNKILYKSKNQGLKLYIPRDQDLDWHVFLYKNSTDIIAACCIMLFRFEIKCEKYRTRVLEWDIMLVAVFSMFPVHHNTVVPA